MCSRSDTVSEGWEVGSGGGQEGSAGAGPPAFRTQLALSCPVRPRARHSILLFSASSSVKQRCRPWVSTPSGLIFRQNSGQCLVSL